MDLSPEMLVMGQLAVTKSGIFGFTTSGLVDRFGSDRVRDFAVSENLMTAAAMGAALAGLRPVIVHQRLDFMIYSLDAIVNWLSLWRFKSNGHSGLPVTIADHRQQLPWCCHGVLHRRLLCLQRTKQPENLGNQSA